MQDKKYLSIVSFCESCLEKYGDNYLGVAWTKKREYADIRYQVMLEVIKSDSTGKIKLLDFGCGASHLYEYILRSGVPRNNLKNIEYSGLDISKKFFELSKSKFPTIKYYNLDILESNVELPEFDYITINGIFTLKCNQSFDEMFSFFQSILIKLFEKVRIGIAFNVMSKQVEWERDDLFHIPFDLLASFLTKNLSRNFIFRHDYRLYEYTTYVYK